MRLDQGPSGDQRHPSVSNQRPSPPVAVVVLNWHRRAQTLACADALARLSYPNWSLVVVDNGCRELSAADLQARVARATYLHSEANLGFAGGANLGLREALRQGAEWVWFLNDDARPEPSALDELLAVACGTPGADVVGAKILRPGDPARLDSIGIDVDLERGRLRLIGHDEIDRGQYDGRHSPLAVTGCAMLVGRAALELLDGFEPAFFAYMEDADLCLRARRAGLRVAFAPRARVLHDRPPAHRGRQSPQSVYYSTRNHLLLLQRHCPGPPWQRKLQELRVYAWSAASALSVGRHAPLAALRAVWRGVRDYRAARYGPSADDVPGPAPPAL